LQSPQIARVNADSLSFTTTALASNRPPALQPHGFADLCITRWSYVGITNNFPRRRGEWEGTYDIRSMNGSCKVTKDQARGIEQVMRERNPQFDNKINSISPKRDWYNDAKSWAERWLEEHGF
ncbi:hypothetical protein V4890_20245, partial [Ralstonia solanacearum species complex bacterium KE056]|uniref:hypothetical protein n=1 Tax=Ralstonia solanacearum species complex bacterium KE056 TaxID=3119585 RepID=UPI002FC3D4DA